jgi:hypothetical protein
MQTEVSAEFEAEIKLDVDGEHFDQVIKGELGGQVKWDLSLGK